MGKHPAFGLILRDNDDVPATSPHQAVPGNVKPCAEPLEGPKDIYDVLVQLIK